MKIGILTTIVGSNQTSGLYNSQQIGIAKQFDEYFEKVLVYIAVPMDKQRRDTAIKECKNTIVCEIPTKQIGNNGLFDCDQLDTTIDYLLYFSDMQQVIPKVSRWCRNHQVELLLYTGVIESHSNSTVKRIISSLLFRQTAKSYKKHISIAKTPYVFEKMKKKGIQPQAIVPVGLDTSLLKQDSLLYSESELKVKYGFGEDEKVLLFIGRMVEEKQPVRMIEIFHDIYQKDEKYRLIMVGTGPLLDKVKRMAAEGHLPITFYDAVYNKDIWELYRISEAYVNLNQQEIFGMAILEAMYYECKVVAWHAPGPDYIIEDRVSGLLADSNEEVVEKILHGTISGTEGKNRVIQSFTWEASARKIMEMICFSRMK